MHVVIAFCKSVWIKWYKIYRPIGSWDIVACTHTDRHTFTHVSLLTIHVLFTTMAFYHIYRCSAVLLQIYPDNIYNQQKHVNIHLFALHPQFWHKSYTISIGNAIFSDWWFLIYISILAILESILQFTCKIKYMIISLHIMHQVCCYLFKIFSFLGCVQSNSCMSTNLAVTLSAVCQPI